MRRNWFSRQIFILFFLVLAAFFIRAYRIDFNIPYLYHIDESGYTNLILTFFQKLNFNPGRFHAPHFYHYTMSFFYSIFFFAGVLIGKFQEILNFQVFFTLHFPLFLLIGRYFSAILGSVNVVLVYLIAKKICGARAGLIAAGLFAFNYLHAQYSHLVCPRILSTFFLSLALLFTVKFFYNKKYFWYILTGCFMGLATATEYSSVLIIISFLFAHFSGSHSFEFKFTDKLRDLKLYIGIIIFIVVFCIAAPLNLSNFRGFLQGLNTELIKYKTGFLSMNRPGANPYVYYWRIFLHNTGLLFVILSALSTIYFLFKKEKVFRVIIVFPVFLLCFLLSTSYVYDQYVIPTLPFFAIAVGVFLDRLLSKIDLSGWSGKTVGKRLIYFSLVSSLLFSGVEVLKFDYYRSKKDSRILAKEWLDSHVNADTKILTDMVVNSLPVENSSFDVQGGEGVGQSALGAGGYRGRYNEYMIFLKKKGIDPYGEKFSAITDYLKREKKYYVFEFSFPVNPEITYAVDPDLLRSLSYYIENGYKYLLLDPKYFDNFPHSKLRAELDVDGTLIKRFPQENLDFFNRHDFPIPSAIEIYKIGDK
jgi:4-amino-4-deoxy-L-arabinose transferase-like glycosyltransferase